MSKLNRAPSKPPASQALGSEDEPDPFQPPAIGSQVPVPQPRSGTHLDHTSLFIQSEMGLVDEPESGSKFNVKRVRFG
jgi:hypothetical protein